MSSFAVKIVESLLNKQSNEQLLALDIGSTSVKLLEMDISGSKPKILAIGSASLPGGIFTNNTINDTDLVGKIIRDLVDESGATSTKVSFCLPGPAAFVKKVNTPAMSLKEFDQNIIYEASNYIPDDIEAVHFDYQVVGLDEETQEMDAIIIAIKNDIILSFVQSIESAGLQPVIADIDYFAMQNMFEHCYPEEQDKVIALIDIGARYARVNIVHQGVSLFNGDVAVGGRMYNEALK